MQRSTSSLLLPQPSPSPMPRTAEITQIINTVTGVCAPFGYAIVGGQAMIEHGLSQRPTDDLDVFTPLPSQAEQATPAVIAALEHVGHAAHVVMAEQDFVRIIVLINADSETTFKVELGRDFRSLPPVALPSGPTIHLDDLAASKMSAALSRNEPRDLCDLYALSMHYSVDEMITLARVHDPGFVTDVFVEFVARTLALSDERWAQVSNVDVAAIRSFAERIVQGERR